MRQNAGPGLTRLIPFLLSGFLIAGCANGVQDDNSLGDLSGMAFQGMLIDADLGALVRITDNEANVRITFSGDEDERLEAQVRLSEGLEFFHGGGWKPFEGPETEEIDGLTVANEVLSGYIKLEGVTLTFDGLFNTERTRLEVGVDFIGSLTLLPWQPADEEGDDDSSQED
ncbi:MAG: hypothetical protein HQ488_00355 [Parcubacteria group bacterium]|nr:hypothetical protein [Parcubacteria group bacterium]